MDFLRSDDRTQMLNITKVLKRFRAEDQLSNTKNQNTYNNNNNNNNIGVNKQNANQNSNNNINNSINKYKQI